MTKVMKIIRGALEVDLGLNLFKQFCGFLLLYENRVVKDFFFFLCHLKYLL